jgi:hypothetical protein
MEQEADHGIFAVEQGTGFSYPAIVIINRES